MSECVIDPTITVILSWPDPEDPETTLSYEIPPECDDSGVWWNELIYPDFDLSYEYAPKSQWISGDVLLSVSGTAAPLTLTVAARGTSVTDLEAHKALLTAALTAEWVTVTILSHVAGDTPEDVVLGRYPAQPALPKWGQITPQMYGLLAAEGGVLIPCNPPEDETVTLLDVGEPKGENPDPDPVPDPGPGGGDDSDGGAPEPGELIGMPDPGDMYLGTSTIQSGREAYMGQRMGAHRTFWNDTTSKTNSAVSQATTDIGIGRVPWLSFKIGVTWASAAAGNRNVWFSDLCTRLDAIGGGPIIVTIHHEPNGDGQPAASYVAMYAELKAISDAYPQIWLAPVLSAGYYQITGGGGWRVEDWEDPESCDMFGLDNYNEWSPANGKTYRSVDDTFRLGGIAQCLALDATKPIGIAEWGVRTKTPAGTSAAWMQDAYDYCREHNVVVMTYFDSGLNSPSGPWLLDKSYLSVTESPAERLIQFKTLLTDAHSVLIPPGGIT